MADIFKWSGCVMLTALVGCSAEKTTDPETVGLILNLNKHPPDTALVERATLGLTAWGIGLDTTLRSRSRNTGGLPGSYNPPDWLAISGRDCMAMGSPESLRKDCPFSDSAVVGVCQVIFDLSDGRIMNSTALVARDYQENENAALADRESIFVHEIGHCLGLRHSSQPGDVMFPNTSGADLPSQHESKIIQAAYTTFLPPDDPAPFFQTSGIALRHFSLPGFYLYDGAPYGAAAESDLPALLPVPGGVPETYTFLLFADGHSEGYRGSPSRGQARRHLFRGFPVSDDNVFLPTPTH